MDTSPTERGAVERLREMEFLGAEFLTWLWWRCEAGGGLFSIPSVGDVFIQFVKLVRLESGTQSNREMVQCLGRAAQEMKEAKTGLLLGKKVARARLVIKTETITMEVTISSKALDFHGLKIVSGFDDTLEEVTAIEGARGLVLLKLNALKEARLIIHSIFDQFVSKRLDAAVWAREKKGVREWILSLST